MMNDVNMRGEIRVSKQKLEALMKNYKRMTISELSTVLEVKRSVVISWVAALRKEIKKRGQDPDFYLPKKKNKGRSVFSDVISDMVDNK